LARDQRLMIVMNERLISRHAQVDCSDGGGAILSVGAGYRKESAEGGRAMEFEGESLDRVLHKLYTAISESGRSHQGSRGATRELLSVSLRILKPRARISRSENRGKPFSAIGELLWYLSGSDQLDFIKPYVSGYVSDAVNGTIEGAYGPRLLAMRGNINQFDSIERLLTRTPGSRRAVIQLFNAEDIATDHKEIPCTTTLQFHLREGLPERVNDFETSGFRI
jgi:thymidylate synthase